MIDCIIKGAANGSAKDMKENSVVVIGVLLMLSVNVHYTVSFFILAHIGVTILAGKKINGISETYASRLQVPSAERRISAYGFSV